MFFVVTVAVSVLCLLHTVLWVDLGFVIVAFFEQGGSRISGKEVHIKVWGFASLIYLIFLKCPMKMK